MSRQSSFLKWGHNNRQKSLNKNWIHPPDTLQNGNITYHVKYLGETDVDQPKGIEVIKDAIRKLRFNQQLKKAEGEKIQKVELSISVDGVAIQDPKTKRRMHQYPLHRISYCADDKSDKKFFSFIAKEDSDINKHTCFVFVSDKLSEEITLTIGQAFDMAYRKFLETSGQHLEMKKQLLVLQKRVKLLEEENAQLKQRIIELQVYQDKSDGDDYKREREASESTPEAIQKIQPPPRLPRSSSTHSNQDGQQSEVGRKLENLLMEEMFEDDFDPRLLMNGQSRGNVNLMLDQHQGTSPSSQGTPVTPTLSGKDLFGATPFVPASVSQNNSTSDPFGDGDFNKMATFGTSDFAPGIEDLEEALGMVDRRILEMKEGFSRGISFGNDDFGMAVLDPAPTK